MRRGGGRIPAAYGVWKADFSDTAGRQDVRYGYNSQLQLTSVTYPDGFAAAGNMTVRADWQKRSRATEHYALVL